MTSSNGKKTVKFCSLPDTFPGVHVRTHTHKWILRVLRTVWYIAQAGFNNASSPSASQGLG